MKEDFLHFIWRFQYYNDIENLTTEDGKKVIVKSSGVLNHNAGPDFLNAKVIIDEIEWNGNIELHINTSDWKKHKHEYDKAYETTILHIVWNHDCNVNYSDGTQIPVISLKKRVSTDLILRYESIQASLLPIPCQNHLANVEDFTLLQTLERTLVQRLEQKAAFVKKLLVANKYDWRETAYQLLAQNMGFKINKEPFLNLAQKTKYKWIQKHLDQEIQVEALLFGQSGLIPENSTDHYTRLLKQEYTFLKQKYKLTSIEPISWKLMRTRPANFPTVRIAQLVKILQKNNDLFSHFLKLPTYEDYISFLKVDTSDYWKTHYLFGGQKDSLDKKLGISSIENILINTVAPLLACYAIEKNKMDLMDKAVDLLEAIPAEQNKITRLWKKNDVKLNNAADTQAAIQLFNESCFHKKCLECSIGFSILKEKEVLT